MPEFNHAGANTPQAILDIPGGQDSTWHNEACPSIEFILQDGWYLHIFTDFENPEDREAGCEEHKRFNVMAYNEDVPGHEYGNSRNGPELSTDNPDQVVSYIIERIGQ